MPKWMNAAVGSVFGAAVLWVGLQSAVAQTTQPIPDEFKDPETGARIIHASRVPNTRSGVIYFHQGTWAADSKRFLFHVQFEEKWRNLYSFNLETNAVTPLVTDRLTANQDVAPKSGTVYYQADKAIWSVSLDKPEPKKIVDLPGEWSTGGGLSVNADETLVAGCSEVVPPTTQPVDPNEPPETRRLKAMGSTFDQHRLNWLYTVNLKTGELKIIHRVNTWLGHIQFSPTDPDLLMFCHEGPWQKVDRIWTIRMSGGDASIYYHRTEPSEIAGHEFWSPDGKAVWFQQIFRERKEGFLTRKALDDGKLTQYRMTPETAAIHHVISPDGTFFVGDGTGKTATGPSKYLTVQVPDGDTFKVTKLCSLQANDYTQCEPNPHISPDQKWVVFTATFHGTPQAYALELPEKLWRK